MPVFVIIPTALHCIVFVIYATYHNVISDNRVSSHAKYGLKKNVKTRTANDFPCKKMQAEKGKLKTSAATQLVGKK